MILQALADYYERKRTVDPDATPEWGFEHREIPFVIVLSEEGEFLNIEDTRDTEAGKKKGRRFSVPRGEKRTSGIRANLLWDKPDYGLGFVAEGKKEEDGEKKAKKAKPTEEEVVTTEEKIRVHAILRGILGDLVLPERVLIDDRLTVCNYVLDTVGQVICKIVNEGRTFWVLDNKDKARRRRLRPPQEVHKDAEALKEVHKDAEALKRRVRYLLRVREQHRAFRKRIEEVFGPDPEDAGLRAMLAFLRAGEHDAVWKHSTWPEVASTTGAYVGFRLSGDTRLICERPEVLSGIRAAVDSGAAALAQCLVTGETGPIAALHPAIKGVRGAQSSGANIVSFNLSAFRTHSRKRGANAPVSERAAFAYTTALNFLLHRDSPTNAHVGGTSVVFWAEKGNEIRNLAGALFGDNQEVLDDPDRGVDRLKAVYAAPAQGAPPAGTSEERFYVLGLAPNAARLAIRFWRPTTVERFAAVVLRHFEDVDVVRPEKAARYPSVAALLRATVPGRRKENRDGNIPPNLAGAVVDAILTGQPYPRHLLVAAIQRARAERNVSPDRAAIIKGCLIRVARHSANDPEVSVAIDEGNHNIGYLLGRLFATLEKVQRRANPKVKSGIRERYYGAASTTPTAVFPTLLKLKNHHLAKIENPGAVVNFERLLGTILEGVESFPTVLSLPDQGHFALGYYHQRQSFFTKSNKAEEVSHA